MLYNSIGIAFTISIMWAISPIIQKYVLNSLVKETIILISSFCYFCCVALYSIYNHSIICENITKVKLKHFLLILLAAITGAFLPNILFLKILKKNKTSIVTALTYTSPLFTVLFAYFFLRERMNVKIFIGILFIIFGVILITLNDGKSIQSEEPFL